MSSGIEDDDGNPITPDQPPDHQPEKKQKKEKKSILSKVHHSVDKFLVQKVPGIVSEGAMWAPAIVGGVATTIATGGIGELAEGAALAAESGSSFLETFMASTSDSALGSLYEPLTEEATLALESSGEQNLGRTAGRGLLSSAKKGALRVLNKSALGRAAKVAAGAAAAQLTTYATAAEAVGADGAAWWDKNVGSSTEHLVAKGVQKLVGDKEYERYQTDQWHPAAKAIETIKRSKEHLDGVETA